LFGGRADAKLLSCSWRSIKGLGGGKKQATGERGGCAASIRGLGLGRRSVGSIPLSVLSARLIASDKESCSLCLEEICTGMLSMYLANG